ncbi:unnamed protein product [Rotaria magnacalcarata]|uniref:D-3-phosphoglycerate dehydrogenase n=1 Tax=Rotaria magnacalcarata TaxID=392030 RepID=A0A819Z4T6_9BILA|nr:unnamed protein product [Rotaria magnacalcarata]CAF1671858.1 unnamed protein product [Rotaria magnacalcarata]CAF1995763.1 unnamed protein product [Rotaria magnacalcarata]CAF2093646.1 unnamed protein product [Rotaria magnacalcarata]CAF2141581.1 unnamed protein product [Rotaria magnacalcarata]
MDSYDDMNRALITDDVDSQCVDMLIANGFLVEKDITLAKQSQEQLIKKVQEVDILIVRSATKVTSAVIEGSPRLKLIGRAGTGTDNIDTEAATRHGILVMNTPGGNTLSAAEHTCTLICSLARAIPSACASLKSGAWHRSEFMGEELNGKTLAIVGLGKIGREVAKRMQSFNMKTIGYDPFITAEQCLTFGVEFFELKDLWPLADYITVHVPYMEGTHYLINDEVLSLCKRGVKLINVARGGIIDENALLDALNSGQSSGAALDVFEQEPPANLKLIQHPLVICTPHLGASTREAQKRVAIDLAQQIIDFKQGHSLIGVVNGSAVTSQFAQGNRAILLLCKRLGQIIGASSSLTPSEISLSFNHTVSNHLFEALSIYFSYGYLHEKGNKRVNFVNARHLFEVKMEMVVDKKQELNNVLVVRISGNNEIKELSGIVSGEHLWLNSVNQCRFIAHVPLDDENVHVLVRPIKGSLMDYLRDNTSQINNRISAVFDTIIPTGRNIQDQRWCAILL